MASEIANHNLKIHLLEISCFLNNSYLRSPHY
ncbi:hypothetical protein A2U01_0114364, partial [Trifolium medium]|nr:hypothetical protein [Trifolium medium]